MTIKLKTIPESEDIYERDQWRRALLQDTEALQTQIDNLLNLPLVLGTAPNTVTISEKGITYQGDKTVWEDLNFSTLRSRNAANAPNERIVGNRMFIGFSTNDKVHDSDELPHARKPGSDVFFHCHGRLRAGESTGTIEFTIYFSKEVEGQSAGTEQSVVLSGTITNENNFDIYTTGSDFSDITGLGTQVNVAFERTGGTAGEVYIHSFGIHYEKDRDGSAQIVDYENS